MAIISVRTNPVLKRKAQEMLKKLGLDLSTAVNVYLQQIVITGGIPFRVRTANGFYPEEERQILQEEAEALRSGKFFESAEALHRDILGDAEYEAWMAESATRRGDKAVQARSKALAASRKVQSRKAQRGRRKAR
jgi:addiction module RelB/DinJ family antitoxin